ncbi:MAG: hypothetical protein KDN20_03450 [Verrucomicrobiae bacterium]|nr:hypothetical protein [Verrucomicrobiae bacterium]
MSVAFAGCQTFELSDVAPETKGSPMGSVKLGKEGKDFFVIPGQPVTPSQMRGEVPVPPSNIVVFKTRERQPLYKTLRVAGAPIRGFHRTFHFVYEKIANLAFGWMKKDKAPATPPVQAPASGPIVYPAHMAPQTPFASARPLRTPRGPQSEHVFHTTQSLRNGG